ncbi:hypothetical protein L195_g028575, partial [Trifolium pratense]
MKVCIYIAFKDSEEWPAAPPQFATACVFCFSPVVAASDYILFGFTELELNYIFAAQLPVDVESHIANFSMVSVEASVHTCSPSSTYRSRQKPLCCRHDSCCCWVLLDRCRLF